LLSPPEGVESTFAAATQPFGLAFDSIDDLYVSDTTTDDIYEFTSAGVESTFATGFSNPTDLLMDSSGNLYVDNYGLSEIIKIKPGGSESVFATGINSVAMAMDSSGNLYAVNTTHSEIVKITTGGTQSNFAAVNSADTMSGLAFDALGNLYVADSTLGDINKYSSSGALIGLFTAGVPESDRLFFYQNTLYATSLSTANIYQITSGGSVSTFTTVAGATGALREMAIAPVVVPEPGSQVMCLLGAAGIWIRLRGRV